MVCYGFLIWSCWKAVFSWVSKMICVCFGFNWYALWLVNFAPITTCSHVFSRAWGHSMWLIHRVEAEGGLRMTQGRVRFYDTRLKTAVTTIKNSMAGLPQNPSPYSIAGPLHLVYSHKLLQFRHFLSILLCISITHWTYTAIVFTLPSIIIATEH